MFKILIAAGIALCIGVALPSALLAQADNTPAPPVPMSFPQPPAWVMNQAVHAVLLSPSDTVAIKPTKGLFVGGDGSGAQCTITLTLAATGDSPILYQIQPPYLFPAEVVLVKNTGTSCANIVAWY